jgi:cytochrome c oxidase subunit 4
MLGVGWLNFFSILLGVVAWALPLISLLNRIRASGWMGVALCALSLGSCSGSLYLQLLTVDRRVKLSDLAGLKDTLPVVLTACVILLAVTAVLNVIALIVHLVKRKQA